MPHGFFRPPRSFRPARLQPYRRLFRAPVLKANRIFPSILQRFLRSQTASARFSAHSLPQTTPSVPSPALPSLQVFLGDGQDAPPLPLPRLHTPRGVFHRFPPCRFAGLQDVRHFPGVPSQMPRGFFHPPRSFHPAELQAYRRLLRAPVAKANRIFPSMLQGFLRSPTAGTRFSAHSLPQTLQTPQILFPRSQRVFV